MTPMPKSVLHHRLRIQKMSDTEKKKHFAGKGIDLLRSMAWRHGYGQGSDEYTRYHDGKTPDKNTTKINEEQLLEISKKTLSSYMKKANKDADYHYKKNLEKGGNYEHWARANKRDKGIDLALKKVKKLTEISQVVAHRYTMKAIKSHKNLESGYVKDIQSGREPKFADVFRKIGNRAAGINRAQRRLNKEAVNGYTYYMQLAAKAEAEGKKDKAKRYRQVAHAEAQARLKENINESIKKQFRKIFGKHIANSRASQAYLDIHKHKDNPLGIDRKAREMMRYDRISRGKKPFQNEENELQELASDSPSNWGGWQGGFPGNKSAMKGLKGSDNDKAKNMTKPAKKREDGSDKGDEIKLSKEKTKVIFNPTQKETENKLETGDPSVATHDQPREKPTKQVREMTENKAKKLIKKALKGKKVKANKLSKAMNKTSKGYRSGWIYTDKRLDEEELTELSDKVLSNYAQKSVKTNEKDPKYKKRMKGLSQSFQKVGKRPLSMSGAEMHGGEEVVYEDLATWLLRKGVKAVHNHYAKKRMLKAKAAKQIAANNKPKVIVKAPKKKPQRPQQQQQAQQQSAPKPAKDYSKGPWGDRPYDSTGPKVKAKAQPEKPEQTIDKTVSRSTKNKAATGGVSSDNKMSAADFRALLKKNPKLKVKAGGSNEETDLSEMSRNKIGAYVKAAMNDVKKRRLQGFFNAPAARKAEHKINNREKNIGKAVDRLVK